MKYMVEIKEVHVAVVEVEAENEEEAKEKANDIIIEEDVQSNYSYTMDIEDWDVSPYSE